MSDSASVVSIFDVAAASFAAANAVIYLSFGYAIAGSNDRVECRVRDSLVVGVFVAARVCRFRGFVGRFLFAAGKAKSNTGAIFR